jgi:hypothetical protein
VFSLEPAERRGEVGSHRIVPALPLEAHAITDVLFVADLLVLCVLVDLPLVLAGDRLVVSSAIEGGRATELEFEVASAAPEGENQYEG